jgi:hypothetical protein
MSEDGNQKYAAFDDKVPAGSPTLTTQAKDANECLAICQVSSTCNSAAYNSNNKDCALYTTAWSAKSQSAKMEAKQGYKTIIKLPVSDIA